MLSERVSFVVTPTSDETIQLGLAEPAGIGVSNSPLFKDRDTLRQALERAGLPGDIASTSGFAEPRRVSFITLVSLGFF